MTKVFVFDVDGTLTPPRQLIDKEFAEVFLSFCKNNIVYLCSGSDWTKVKEQVTIEVINETSGVFTCSGNTFWTSKGEEVPSLRNDFDVPAELIKDLEGLVKSSNFPIKTGKHIDLRMGMVNFSTVGRNCSKEERDKYSKWDEEVGERKSVVACLKSKYPDIDFNIGGEISIDIHPIGSDKSRAIKVIREWHKEESPSICFFGDKIWPGGNDFLALKEIRENDSYNKVFSYKDTMNLLLLIMNQSV